MLEISFTVNLSRVEGTRMYFIMEGTKKNSFSFRFFKGNSYEYYDFIVLT